ncbi:MAG TPA: hypothetical protein VMP68_20925 [Candidatus Eisenbacteria bacterium]|nr:hypothetical protein [Candidatus Eisenbacteria bacterium]
MSFLLQQLTDEIAGLDIVIEIGDIPVRIITGDANFLQILRGRYAGFVSSAKQAEIELEVELTQPRPTDPEADVEVTYEKNIWALRRGDFRAEWNPETRQGWIQQTANPYSIDAVLRIVHSLVLASQGGFLLHSASAIRNQKAFLFAGVSGAGKTTISRLAPHDVTLLTDEISYVRRRGDGYIGYGTPFTGELAKLGENVSAPISALYLLVQGKENRIEPIAPSDATRSILANLLFFAKDEELVQRVFHSVFEFVTRVTVSRLTFMPDSRVWELIG